MLKKRISVLLVLCMVLSLLPISAVAVDVTPREGSSANTTGYIVNVDAITVTDAKLDSTFTASAPTEATDKSSYVIAGDTGISITLNSGKTSCSLTIEYSVGSDSSVVVKGATGNQPCGQGTIGSASSNGKNTVTFTGLTTATKALWLTATKNGSTHCYKLAVTVKAGTVAVTGVTVSPATLTLKEGETGTLTVTVTPPDAANKAVTWTSSDSSVANVENGKVTALKAGKATITVTTTDGGKTAGCNVTVTAAQGGSGSGGGGTGTPSEEKPTTVEEVTVSTTVSDKTEQVDGKDVTPVTITQEAVSTAITEAAAKAEAELAKTDVESVVVPLKIDASTAKNNAVKVPNNVFSAAKAKNAYYTSSDVNMNIKIVVTVALPKGKAVTLKSAAIDKMLPEGVTGDVVMSVEDTDPDEIPTTQKPSTTGTIKAAFEVNITVGNKGVSWDKKGKENIIVVTVPKTKDIPTKLSRLVVYLDKTKAPGADVTKNEDDDAAIDIAVPHLTIVSLVEGETSTSGGGGGSGKPSVKPGETQTPTAPSTTPSGVAGFSDVSTSSWYAEYVQYVVDKGLFGGVGNGRFAPNDNMTRAMMWTVLARYMGVNTNTGSTWYEAARAWAIEKGISDGTMADGNVTREQFVTMLWRLSGEPAVSNSASFTDSGSVSAYAKTAVDWAVAQGIVNGYNDGSFKPQGSATRAEVAKMLTVFCTNAENAPAETTPAEPTEDVG